MSRRVARDYVFKLVFEFTFYNTRNDNTLDLFLLDDSLDEDDKAYVQTTYDGVMKHFDELKDIIAKHAKGFSVDRIYRPDLVALLVGSYEIFYSDKVPELVAINEAVTLSKEYGEDKSSKFVNGVLATVLKEKKGD